jgi:arylsulfatase A-like enzyme
MSFLRLLQGKRQSWRRDFLAEYYAEAQFPRIPTWKAVRSPEWKLIAYEGKPEWTEMYRLSNDPYEMTNLAKDPALSAERARLEKRLAALVQQTS